MSEDEYEDGLANLAAYNVAASGLRWRSAYLTGPGVLATDARTRGEDLKAKCARYMLNGLWLADEANETMDAKTLFDIRVAMLRKADIVIADIGPGLDGDTAWEIGFAAALGKAVYAYVDGLQPDAGTATPYPMIAGSVRGPFRSAETAMWEAHVKR